MTQRAYTYIDRGRALLGNTWIERTWSTFLGNTSGLTHKSASAEWARGISPEFAFEVDGAGIGLMDLPDMAWSEENSPLGATLIMEKRSPGLEVSIRTTAFHDAPGIVRQFAIRNRSAAAITLRRVCLDGIKLPPGPGAVLSQGFSLRQDHLRLESDERAVAIVRDNHGLFAGVDGGGLYDFHPREGRAALGIRDGGPFALETGARWDAPVSYWVPFVGDAQAASGGVLAQFFLKLRELRRAGENQ